MEKEYLEVYDILNQSDLTDSLYYKLVSTYGKRILDSVIEQLIEEDSDNFFKFEIYYSKLLSDLDNTADMTNYEIYLNDVSLVQSFSSEKNFEIMKIVKDIMLQLEDVFKQFNCDDNILGGNRVPFTVEKVEYCLKHCNDFYMLSLIKSLYSKFKHYRDMVVEGNLKLVILIASEYKNNDISFDDIIQYGNMGLMKAVEKFDPDNGAAFSTYAIYWIKQSINKNIRNLSSSIRIPLNVVYENYNIFNLRNDLSIELSREVSLVEVANNLGQPYSKLEKMIPFFMGTLSLDESMDSRYDEGELTRKDLIVDESVDVCKSAITPVYRLYLINLLSKILTERELLVLKLYTGMDGIDYTTPEIAVMLGVSKQRVSQIHNNALVKIRKKVKIFDEIID